MAETEAETEIPNGEQELSPEEQRLLVQAEVNNLRRCALQARMFYVNGNKEVDVIKNEGTNGFQKFMTGLDSRVGLPYYHLVKKELAADTSTTARESNIALGMVMAAEALRTPGSTK